MKYSALILFLAASIVAANAQAPAKPAAPAAKPTTAAASKPIAPATKAAPAILPTVAAIIKAPAGIKQYPGAQKPIFTVALRYQDIEIGKGAVAESNKLYKVLYTGYRASDGVIFDSTEKHRAPLRDKDGKPVMGDDGKPKLGDPQPMPFPQGMGSTIIGFDRGFAGMRIGGKRRIFIPWQLAYGTRTIPDHDADHPGIPAKTDLIFDVELVDVTEMPAPPQRPVMGGMRPMPGGAPHPVAPGAPAQPGAVPASGSTAAPTPAAAPAASAAPAPAAAPTPTAPPAPATAPATPAQPK
jgi:peptidylprolyl isomerase